MYGLDKLVSMLVIFLLCLTIVCSVFLLHTLITLS